MIHHCLRNFGFDCFLLGNLTGSQTGLKGFLGFAALTSKKLIALFVDRSRPIKQANPKVLDYIAQTMVSHYLA
jgi:hypothetical protein